MSQNYDGLRQYSRSAIAKAVNAVTLETDKIINQLIDSIKQLEIQVAIRDRIISEQKISIRKLEGK